MTGHKVRYKRYREGEIGEVPETNGGEKGMNKAQAKKNYKDYLELRKPFSYWEQYGSEIRRHLSMDEIEELNREHFQIARH